MRAGESKREAHRKWEPPPSRRTGGVESRLRTSRRSVHLAAVMPPSAKLTQREMLRRLLDSGKLPAGDVESVRKLFDDIVAGRIGGMNHPQSVWAEKLCEQCGVDIRQPGARDTQTTRKKAKEEKDRILAEFDALPRPKKPPGR